MRRRCGDEGAGARSSRRTPGRRRTTRSRASPASTRRRSCATTRTRRRCRCPRRGPARSPARSPRSTTTRPAATWQLRRAIADYNGVEPENVVLGVGADDLILLCARCYAGPGDTIAIPEAPTYPLYRIAALLAGAEVGDDAPVLTFTCRPNSPDRRAARRCPRPGRSSSTRRTSSTAARRPCRCSTTA